MIVTNKKGGIFLGLLLLFLFGLPGCQKAPPASMAPFSRQNTYRLLVIPFEDMTRLYGLDVTIRSPLSGRIFTTGKVAEGADDFLTDSLISFLDRRKSVQLIPSSLAQGVWAQLLSDSQKELPELEMMVEIGRNLGADAVLLGYVYRFKNRVGTEYAVDAPASVAFDIDLISISERTIIWSRRFDETQQALSEDLFQFGKFINRKGRWITAREMAVGGLEELFKTFPLP